ncbi:MAG: GNAT family N-acetyltransferase [Candidatus Thorarchaeota archaeon]|jgi:RimJ/RimL family protein N-acetyltransferase
MLEGKKVRLIIMDKHHIDDILEGWNNPEMRQYLMGYLPVPREGEEQFLESVSQGMIRRTDFVYGIERISDSAFLGTVAVHGIDWVGRNATLGIAIHKSENWSKGYGTESMELLIDFCWTHLNLRRLGLSVHDNNKRALRVYEKLGFKIWGTAHDFLYVNGVYYDSHYLELFREPKKSQKS